MRRRDLAARIARVSELSMRPSKTILGVLALVTALSACSKSADRGTAAPGVTTTAPIAGAPVSVTLESPGMGALPSTLFGGALYFVGQQGQQYAVRIANNTARRVEVVVSWATTASNAVTSSSPSVRSWSTGSGSRSRRSPRSASAASSRATPRCRARRSTPA
jgi:hypothetical protein